MKKIASLLMITVLLIVCFVGCGQKEDPAVADETAAPKNTADVTPENKTNGKNDKQSWGVKNSLIAETSSTVMEVYINFPKAVGLLKGTGKITDDSDVTVIFDAQRMSGSPEVPDDAVENVLPSYFEQTAKILERFRTADYQDFGFTVSRKENFSVNGYDMTKFFGTHTFTYQGKASSMNFAACAAKTKKTGAFVYWMVLDKSENQSLGKTIEEYAVKMAETFSE